MTFSSPQQSRLPQRRLIATATSLAIATTVVVAPVSNSDLGWQAAAQSEAHTYRLQSGYQAAPSDTWFANVFQITTPQTVHEVTLVIDRMLNQRFPLIWGAFPEHDEYLVGLPGGKTVVADGYGSKSAGAKGDVHTLRLVLREPIDVPGGIALQVKKKGGSGLVRARGTLSGEATLVTANDLGGVSGIVRNNLGNPVPNAPVAVYNAQTQRSYSTTTDGSGRYTIEALPPGSYTASVASPPNNAYYQRESVTFQATGGTRASQDLTVELTRGSVAAVVNNAKFGTVVTLSGGPGPGTNRKLSQAGERFDFADLLPGTYTVKVQAPKGYTVSPAMRAVTLTAEDIVAGVVPTPTFTMTATEVPVTITVKDDSGALVPSANVTLIDGAGARITTTADSNGKAVFPKVQPGPYSLEVTGPNGLHRKLTGKLTVREVSGFSAPVTLSTLNEATGVVRDDLGRGVGGAEVRVVNEKLGVDLTLSTAQDGSFDAGRLRAGQYTVTVLADKDGRFRESEAQTLTVTAGQRANVELSVSLNRGHIAVNVDGPVQPKRVYVTDGPDSSTLSQGPSSSPYRFDDLIPGTYSVGVEAPTGYSAKPSTRRLSVPANSQATASFAITADPVSAAFTVLNDANAPVAGAQVALRGADGKETTQTTNRDGRVTFTGVAPGSYTVVVKGASTYSGNAQPVDVVAVAGATKTIRVGSLTTVRGSVVDELGNPVNGKVTVSGSGYSKTVNITDGGFEVSGISSGTYTAEVAPEALKHDGARATFTVDSRVGGEPVSIVVPILRRAAEVSVTGPAENVTLSGGPETVSLPLTLSRGKAQTGPLAPGAYTVAVTPRDGYSVDQPTKTLRVAIEAGTNEPVRTSFAITALPGRVSGLITDVNGVVLTDQHKATVTLFAEDGTRIPAAANGEGRFQVGNLTPGTYRVEVSADNHETTTIPALDVAPGEHKSLTERLRALDGSIAGTVVDQNGTALPGATVQILDADGAPLPQQPEVTGGTISPVGVRPGEYTVRVTPPAGYGEVVDKQVQVGAGQAASLGNIRFVLQKQPVSGSILGQNGEAVQGVTAWLTQKGKQDIPLRVQNGAARADGVLPGTYKIRVSVPSDSGYLAPASPDVTVKPGKAGSFRVVLSKNEGSVKGAVTDENGVAVPGATVGLIDQNNNFVPGTVDGTKVSAPHVKAGTYQVFASAPGYFEQAAAEPVVVRANETFDFGTIRLRERDGVVRGRVVDASGTPVPSATVEVKGGGQTLRAAIDEDGRFSEQVRPGNYTITVTPPAGFTAQTSTQTVTVTRDATAGSRDFVLQKVVTPTTTTPKPTTPKPAPPKDVYSWKPLSVAPGEIALEQAARKGNSNAKVSFSAGKVERVKDGKTEPVRAEDTWIAVQEDGTIVATPPAGTDPGTYRVEVATSAGDTQVVAIEVSQPERMADRYKLTFPPQSVPAGTARQMAAPTADVREGGFTYRGRALPRGTKFEAAGDLSEYVSIDDDGRVTYAPPLGTPVGAVTIPIMVTFPDGSSKSWDAEFTVGDPLYASTVPVVYEPEISVLPGQRVSVLQTNAALPTNTRFELDPSVRTGSWTVSVDEHTGDIRVSAPASGAGPLTVKVNAFFPDGSSKQIEASVGVAPHTALAATQSLSYTSVTATRGATVSLSLQGDAPAGTEFALVDGGGKPVAVDKHTGALRVGIPADASLDATTDIRMRALYSDRSAQELVAKITVASDAQRYTPVFEGANVTPGSSVRVRPAGSLPAGTTFETDFAVQGWSVSIDKETGELIVLSDGSVTPGQEVLIPIRVTYPDGSSEVVTIPVSAVKPVEVRQTQPVADDAAGSSVSWLPIVLGAVAALAGAGYAAFVNQDYIRSVLSQYGINI